MSCDVFSNAFFSPPHTCAHTQTQSALDFQQLRISFVVHDIIIAFFNDMQTFEYITAAVEILANPLAKLWHKMFLGDSTSPGNEKLRNQVLLTWTSMTNALLVVGLSPLLLSSYPSHLCWSLHLKPRTNNLLPPHSPSWP